MAMLYHDFMWRAKSTEGIGTIWSASAYNWLSERERKISLAGAWINKSQSFHSYTRMVMGACLNRRQASPESLQQQVRLRHTDICDSPLHGALIWYPNTSIHLQMLLQVRSLPPPLHQRCHDMGIRSLSIPLRTMLLLLLMLLLGWPQWPAPCQHIAHEAHVHEQLQHALLCEGACQASSSSSLGFAAARAACVYVCVNVQDQVYTHLSEYVATLIRGAAASTAL
eukprot:1159084-Pelagomonas_calceolata.AAC.5